MPVLITELLSRADTGISVKPFICKTEEEKEIYVKPPGSLRRLLISEWIGGRLAQYMELPCAEITIVEIPELLAKANKNPDWYDFRAGIGFGSYSVAKNHRDLLASDISKLPRDLLAEIYLFDYWISNQDRKMGPIAGNPNMLVAFDVSTICLIDHDSAFDTTFNIKGFKDDHLGRTTAEIWTNKDKQQAWLEKAALALSNLEKIWEELPEYWLHSDLDTSLDPVYTIDHYRTHLNKPFVDTEYFWKELLQ